MKILVSMKYFNLSHLVNEKKYNQLPPYLKVEVLEKVLGREDKPIAVIEFRYGHVAPAIVIDYDNRTENPEDLLLMGEIAGRKHADLHGEKVRMKKEQFNLFGLEKVVPIVNDAHFEYEIREAIAAYKYKLYLGATATVAVALENILSLMIKRKLGEREIPRALYIKDFLKVLVDKRILDERTRRSIMGFNNIRNGASHSNSGEMHARDSQLGFEIIKELINDHFE